MNAPLHPSLTAHLACMSGLLEPRVPVGAVESDIPWIWRATAGQVAITAVAIVNDLCDAGMDYRRALGVAHHLIADCVVDDSMHREWQGFRMAEAPRWYYLTDGQRSADHASEESAWRELRSFITIHRHGSPQWRAISSAEEIERFDRAQRMTAEREGAR